MSIFILRGSAQEEVGNLFFEDGFESGSMSGWPGAGVGGVTVANTDVAGDGTYYCRASLDVGSNNDKGDYSDIGTAGNLSTQFRNGFLQFKCSFDSFTGNWPSAPQKLMIVQYYDSTWNGGSFSNANRKFQVIVSVAYQGLSQVGQYYVQLIEWNNTTDGSFRDGANLFQNSTTVGPASSFGSWDQLRLEIQLDTNGSTTVGQLGTGNGNGIIRLWCNGTLIMEHTNVNIVRGNANVGCGRLLLTSTSNPGTWVGTASALYWDTVQFANVSSLLNGMQSSASTRSSSYVPAIFKQMPFRSGSAPNYDTGATAQFNGGATNQMVTGGGPDGGNCVRVTFPQGASQIDGKWFGSIGTPSGGYTQGGILTIRFRSRHPTGFRWDGSGSQQNKQFILRYTPSGNSRFMLHNERPDGNSWSLPDEYASATNNGHFGYWSMKHNIGTPATNAVPLTYQGGPTITPNPSVTWVAPDALGWYHVQMQIKTPSTSGGNNGTFKIWVNNNNFASPNSQATGCSVDIPFGEFEFGGFWTDPNGNRACSFDYQDFQAEWATAAQGEQLRFNPAWFPS